MDTPLPRYFVEVGYDSSEGRDGQPVHEFPPEVIDGDTERVVARYGEMDNVPADALHKAQQHADRLNRKASR